MAHLAGVAQTAQQHLLAFVSPVYEDVALNELRDQVDARLVRSLTHGVFLASTSHDADEVARRCLDRPPVFVRQLLLEASSVARTSEIAVDASAVANQCRASGSAAVAVRDVSGRRRHGLEALETAVASLLAGSSSGNHYLVVATPDEYVTGRILAGAGVSDAPFWPAGFPVIPLGQRFVSRSALKLLEAIGLFSVPLATHGNALDLGAAPGGWSQVLAGYGMRVTAVDPGELDPRVRRQRDVHAVTCTAQAFIGATSERFDVVVNDMRLDARESARLLVAARPLLLSSAIALITLKLPEHSPSIVLKHALAILREGFAILGVRCLYYNRNEVTVFARPRA